VGVAGGVGWGGVGRRLGYDVRAMGSGGVGVRWIGGSHLKGALGL